MMKEEEKDKEQGGSEKGITEVKRILKRESEIFRKMKGNKERRKYMRNAKE